MKFQTISTIFFIYVAGTNAALPLLIDSLVNGARNHKRDLDLDVGTEIPHLKCLSWDGIHCIPTSLPVEAREAEAEAEAAVKVLEMRSFRA